MAHRIVVIDDHEIAHSAIRLLIADRTDLKLDRCFREASPALSYLREQSADIVVLDLDLPDRSGIDVLEVLRDELDISVLVLSGSTRVPLLHRCRELGAHAIVSKGDRVEETLSAFDHILSGQRYFSPDIVAMLAQSSGDDGGIALSERQGQILQRVARGLSNKEIAYDLAISQPTVSFHLRELVRKLGAEHPRQLVERARSAGLL